MTSVKQLILFYENFKKNICVDLLYPEKATLNNKYNKSTRTAFIWISLFFLFGFSIRPSVAQIEQINSFTFGAGAYSSSGIATNPLFEFRFNRYLEQGKHFFEFSFGFSSVKSDVLNTFAGAQLFENNNLFTTELVYGYDPKMWSSVPYFTFGVANISQGGQSKIAAVLGIGNRILIDSMFNSKNFGIRYDIRDHILRQKFNSDAAFTAHNFVLTLNLEYFF